MQDPKEKIAEKKAVKQRSRSSSVDRTSGQSKTSTGNKASGTSQVTSTPKSRVSPAPRRPPVQPQPVLLIAATPTEANQLLSHNEGVFAVQEGVPRAVPDNLWTLNKDKKFLEPEQLTLKTSQVEDPSPVRESDKQFRCGKFNVKVPLGEKWEFMLDGKMNSFIMKQKHVQTLSHYASVSAADRQTKRQFVIKCTSIQKYFEELSTEINSLNLLSQDPIGFYYFPRVLFYNFHPETRFFFGLDYYEVSLEKRIQEFDKHGVCLHFIRYILKQLLQATCVLNKYGIKASISSRSIRMKSRNRYSLAVVLKDLSQESAFVDDGKSYVSVGFESRPIEEVFKTGSTKRSEEWSVAAIAYRMIVGEGPGQSTEGQDKRAAIVYGAHELLGNPPGTELLGNMGKWYEQDVETGRLVLKKACQEEKKEYINARRLKNIHPKKLELLDEVRPDDYKTLDQKKDIILLQEVVESMYKYIPKERDPASKVLNLPFFTIDRKYYSTNYIQVANRVCQNDTATIEILATSNQKVPDAPAASAPSGSAQPPGSPSPASSIKSAYCDVTRNFDY